MANARFLKARAWFGVGLFVIFYPILLIITALAAIYRVLFGRKPDKSINGDVAVIFGASQGLSRGIAQELAARGCHIALVERKNDGILKTAEFISEKYNVKAKAYQIDATNYEEVEALNENVSNDLGLATILINNMDSYSFKAQPTVTDISAFISNNYTVQYWLKRTFFRNMRKANKGNFVAICAVESLFTLPHRNLYCSTKHALRTALRILRLELRLRRCNNIGVTMALYTPTQAAHATSDSSCSTTDNVAARIVHGLLQHEEEVIVPGYLSLLYRLYELLPTNAQILLSRAAFLATEIFVVPA